jgi:hypothetical protein
MPKLTKKSRFFRDFSIKMPLKYTICTRTYGGCCLKQVPPQKWQKTGINGSKYRFFEGVKNDHFGGVAFRAFLGVF